MVLRKSKINLRKTSLIVLIATLLILCTVMSVFLCVKICVYELIAGCSQTVFNAQNGGLSQSFLSAVKLFNGGDMLVVNGNILLYDSLKVSLIVLTVVLLIVVTLAVMTVLFVVGSIKAKNEEISKYNEAFSRYNKSVFEFDIKQQKLRLSPFAQSMLNVKFSSYDFQTFSLELDLSQQEMKSILKIFEMVYNNGHVEQTFYVSSIHKYMLAEMHIQSLKKDSSFVFGTLEDVTATVLTAQAQEDKVKIDSLTKLFNFEAFEQIVDQHLLSKPDSRSAFLLMDIDNFRHINERYGHYVGDMLLQKFAMILQTISKKNNLYPCRLTNDEFALFVPSFSAQQELKELASQICFETETFSILGENIYDVFISIGISLYPSNANSYEKLHQCADNALYRSKKCVGSRISFFDSMENELSFEPNAHYHIHDAEEKFSRIISQVGGEEKITKILTDALNSEEIKLYLQPKISVKTDDVECEVLARWQSPEYGLIMPTQFLPMFEYAKMMPEFDKYVLENSFKFITECKSVKEDLKISINQSLESITSPQYIRIVEQLVEKYKVPKGAVTIELTERCMFISLRTISKVISLLHNTGFRVSIDDFGTGYTTLNIIKDLDVDEIKIDKTFINTDDEKASTIVTKLCQMASTLNLVTVAEGVRTAEQMKFLTDIGCDYLQGFYFSRAVPIEGFIQKYTSGEYIAKKYVA